MEGYIDDAGTPRIKVEIIGRRAKVKVGALGSRFKFKSANCLIGIFGGRR